jgi:putative exosortase-associated protein (TIGR04073 family)
MSRIAQGTLVVFTVCSVTGCLASPFTKEVQRVEVRLGSLQNRVSRLELFRSVSPATFSGGGSTTLVSQAGTTTTSVAPGTVVAPSGSVTTVVPFGGVSTGGPAGSAVTLTETTPGVTSAGSPGLSTETFETIPGDGVSGVQAGETISVGSTTGSGFQLPMVPFNTREALGKLVRGLVNVLTGWVEIPKRVHETSEESGPGAGFTLGMIRGLGYGLTRTLGGLYEVVTFPVPAPPGYQPVMRPPYIFVCEADTATPP